MKQRRKPNKKVRNATPTDYDGIHFRSKLEVYCYKQLQKFKIEAEYEPIRFTILDSFRYDGKAVQAMTYTPDFVGKDFIIEVKGHANESFPLRWKVFKHFLHNNNLKYNLYLPRNKKDVDNVIKDILKKKEDEKKVL